MRPSNPVLPLMYGATFSNRRFSGRWWDQIRLSSKLLKRIVPESLMSWQQSIEKNKESTTQQTSVFKIYIILSILTWMQVFWNRWIIYCNKKCKNQLLYLRDHHHSFRIFRFLEHNAFYHFEFHSVRAPWLVFQEANNILYSNCCLKTTCFWRCFMFILPSYTRGKVVKHGGL